jgi:hypothetical protein
MIRIKGLFGSRTVGSALMTRKVSSSKAKASATKGFASLGAATILIPFQTISEVKPPLINLKGDLFAPSLCPGIG